MADLELNFYSRLYDNFFDDEMCDAYIDSFEETMKRMLMKWKKQASVQAPFVLTRATPLRRGQHQGQGYIENYQTHDYKDDWGDARTWNLHRLLNELLCKNK